MILFVFTLFLYLHFLLCYIQNGTLKFSSLTFFLILVLEKKNLTFIKKPTLPTHLFCGKYFSATCMKNLVSDIPKVFREVVELNLFMALSLRLFTNVNISLRGILDRSAMSIIWHYVALWDQLQLDSIRL